MPNKIILKKKISNFNKKISIPGDKSISIRWVLISSLATGISKAKNLLQRGSSINKIRNYLLTKGINEKYVNQSITTIKENNEDQDFFSAIKICKKKRIGPARDENNRPLFYKKDIGILARSGFDFDTSKRVMDIDKDEYLKIINLL